MELNDELPPESQFKSKDQNLRAHQPGPAPVRQMNDNPLLPIAPGSQLFQPPRPVRQRGQWLQQMRQIPRAYLFLLLVSSLIIVALLPQFLITVSAILIRILLVLRVLILPILAVMITLWVIRMFYPRTPRN